MAKQPKRYIITYLHPLWGSGYSSRPLTTEEAVKYYSYMLDVGASWAHERGNKKINRNPSTIKSLIANLNNASKNSAANGFSKIYSAEEYVE